MSRFGLNPTLVFLALLFIAIVSRVGPLGELMFRMEYDYAAIFSPSQNRLSEEFLDGVVVIYLDEESHQVLGEPYDAPWDRSIHARLVDKLTDAASRLVYFDILFLEPSSNAKSDRLLEAAISKNGSVFLVGQLANSNSRVGERERVLAPISDFRDASAGWGTAAFASDRDGAIRRKPIELESVESAPMAVAKYLGRLAKDSNSKGKQTGELLYYFQNGPVLPNNVWSYHEVISDSFPSQLLEGKIVFIGAKQSAGYSGTGKDTFKSPFSRVSGGSWNGVDFHVVALENYLSGKGIRRMAFFEELIWLILSGGLLTSVLLLSSDRPRYIYLVFLGILLPAFGAYWGESHGSTFPFLSILFIQSPLAGLATVLDRPVRKEVFISYSRKDADEEDYFDPLIRSLEKAGLRCWADKHDIDLGEDWREAILKGIEQSRGFILLVSQRTPDSAEIRSEIRLADHNKLKKFHILLDKQSAEKLQDELGRYQGFDYSDKKISEIDFDQDAKVIRSKLGVSWIRIILNRVFPGNRIPPVKPKSEISSV